MRATDSIVNLIMALIIHERDLDHELDHERDLDPFPGDPQAIPV